MQTIKITIADKRAQVEGSPVLVCNNTGDKITFSFDDEWTGLSPKVARFAYTRDGRGLYQDVAFTADTVEIPPLSDISCVRVGVYAGELSTTTAAAIPCLPSILSGPGGMDGAMIFPSDYGRFKLWNDITLEEDTQLINISKTDDGKPLKIKKLFLYFFGKFNSAAALCLKYNNGSIYQSWMSVTESSETIGFWISSEKITDGVYRSLYPDGVLTQITNSGYVQGLSTHNKNVKSDFAYTPSVKTGTSIIFGAHSSYPDFKMLAGSRILIWGVQDDD